jgi:hypothetical protein
VIIVSDPNEVDQVDDEQVTVSDPQLDPSNGVAPNGIAYPQPDPRIGEGIKW